MNQIIKDDLFTGYNNIKRIIDMLIRTNNIAFRDSDKAPSTFKDMKQCYDKHGEYLVYNGGDHGLLGQEYNIKFRALHDAMHLENNLTFKFEDEKQLSDITKEIFMEIAWATLNLTTWETLVIGEIINAEIKGQIEYYEKHNSYVENQTDFIYDYLKVAA